MIKKILKYLGFIKEERIEDRSVKGKPVTDLLSAIDPDFKPEDPPSVMDQIKREKDLSKVVESKPKVEEIKKGKPVTVNDLDGLNDKVDSLKSIMEEKKLISELVKYQKEISQKEQSSKERENLTKIETINAFFKEAKTDFTDKEFNQRKMEILKFLRDLKNNR